MYTKYTVDITFIPTIMHNVCHFYGWVYTKIQYTHSPMFTVNIPLMNWLSCMLYGNEVSSLLNIASFLNQAYIQIVE